MVIGNGAAVTSQPEQDDERWLYRVATQLKAIRKIVALHLVVAFCQLCHMRREEVFYPNERQGAYEHADCSINGDGCATCE